MSGTPGAEPITEAYFGFYLLAMGTGRPRTAEELAALLRQAGFAGRETDPDAHAVAGARHGRQGGLSCVKPA